MPIPEKNEKEDDFISRYMAYPDLQDKGEKERLGECYGIWKEHSKKEEHSQTKGNMEKRYNPLEVRNKDGEISGYASVWYDGTEGTEYNLFDNVWERFAPRAYDDHLSENPDVIISVNHNLDRPLGRTASKTAQVWDDTRGLGYKVKPRKTDTTSDLVASIEHGDFGGSSVTFEAIDVEWRMDGDKEIRYIRKARVYECGPVVSPAYASASVGIRAEERSALQKERDNYKSQIETERKIAKLNKLLGK